MKEAVRGSASVCVGCGRSARTKRRAASLANGRLDMAGGKAARRRSQTCGVAALQARRRRGEWCMGTSSSPGARGACWGGLGRPESMATAAIDVRVRGLDWLGSGLLSLCVSATRCRAPRRSFSDARRGSARRGPTARSGGQTRVSTSFGENERERVGMREEDDCGIEAVSSTRKGGSRRWHARLGRWTGSCLPPSCLNKEEDKEIFAN